MGGMFDPAPRACQGLARTLRGTCVLAAFFRGQVRSGRSRGRRRPYGSLIPRLSTSRGSQRLDAFAEATMLILISRRLAHCAKRIATQLSAQRYVSVAAKPNAVRFACSRPQRSINRLDSALACSIAMASSLWLVGMMLKMV